MNKKLIGTIKFLITIAIVCSFVWFLVISPMLTFKEYEKTFTFIIVYFIDDICLAGTRHNSK